MDIDLYIEIYIYLSIFYIYPPILYIRWLFWRSPENVVATRHGEGASGLAQCVWAGWGPSCDIEAYFYVHCCLNR